MARNKQGWQRALGNALSMATNMAAAIAVGYFGGRYLDKWLGTEPWLTMLLFLLGVATGLKIVYEQAFGRDQKGSDFGRDDAKESDNNIKVKPGPEIIANLQAARQNLKGIEAEVKKIYQRDQGNSPTEPAAGEAGQKEDETE